MKNEQRFFKLPGIDAKLVIIGNTISFLAQGNSQIKQDGRVIGYDKRNPERLALMKHVFPLLPRVHVIRYGRRDNEPVKGMFKAEDLHKYRKAGKTYRFDIVTHVTDSLINRLGLVETTGKRLPSSQIFKS